MDQQSIAEKIVLTTGDLPSMPHVASLAMEKLSDPDASVKEIQKIISKDQAMAARILRIANSACYARRRAIRTISDAVVTIGFKTIKSIIISSALHDFFNSFGLAEKLMWEHSLGCAFTSRAIAQELKFSKVEEAFLAGLLHDVGKVVLHMKLPKKMQLVVQEVYNNPGTTFIELEQRLFGFDHAQVGQMVANKWNFAEEIVESIGTHHQPDSAEILPPLAHIVFMGDVFCHKMEIGFVKRPDLEVENFPSAKFLALGKDQAEDLLTAIADTFDAEKGLFSS